MGKIGVVFSNLGTPRSPSPKDVGDYLGEFLMDPYVIQMPSLLRRLLVKGIIVRFRSEKSAQLYQEIWSEEGSPLLLETQKAANALQEKLGEGYKVVVAMRYGEPNFLQAKESLKGCEKIIFFPQYPQYAESTVRTSLEHFQKYFSDVPSKVIRPYYENSLFVKAYARYLKEQLQTLNYDHILMSFHGIPESHIHKTDIPGQHCLKENCCLEAQGNVLKTCYRAQCFRSAKAISTELGLKASDYTVSFQSRLGRQRWIQPYTETMYGDLISRGKTRLAVLCPGFPVDGLETLEEIATTGKEKFLSLGGQSFGFVPCLNSNKHWIEACAQMVKNT